MSLDFAATQRKNHSFKNYCNTKEWLSIHTESLLFVENYFKKHMQKEFNIINYAIPFSMNLTDGKNTYENLYIEENRLLHRSARSKYIISLIKHIISKKRLKLLKKMMGNMEILNV